MDGSSIPFLSNLFFFILGLPTCVAVLIVLHASAMNCVVGESDEDDDEAWSGASVQRVEVVALANCAETLSSLRKPELGLPPPQATQT